MDQTAGKKERASSGKRLPRRIITCLIIINIFGIICILWLRSKFPDETPSPRVRSSNLLYSIRAALEFYAEDHQGKLPEKLEDLYPDYVEGESVFVCPRASQKTKWFGTTEEPYEYLVGGKMWDELKDSDILVREPPSVKERYVIRKKPGHPELESNEG